MQQGGLWSPQGDCFWGSALSVHRPRCLPEHQPSPGSRNQDSSWHPPRGQSSPRFPSTTAPFLSNASHDASVLRRPSSAAPRHGVFRRETARSDSRARLSRQKRAHNAPTTRRRRPHQVGLGLVPLGRKGREKPRLLGQRRSPLPASAPGFCGPRVERGRRRRRPTPALSPGESRDGGARWAAVRGAAQRRPRLRRLSGGSSTSRDCPPCVC